MQLCIKMVSSMLISKWCPSIYCVYLEVYLSLNNVFSLLCLSLNSKLCFFFTGFLSKKCFFPSLFWCLILYCLYRWLVSFSLFCLSPISVFFLYCVYFQWYPFTVFISAFCLFPLLFLSLYGGLFIMFISKCLFFTFLSVSG